jgi:hypothetical protein
MHLSCPFAFRMGNGPKMPFTVKSGEAYMGSVPIIEALVASD